MREPQAGTLNRQATSLHRWIPRYYEEDQVIAICRTLSCGDEGSIQIEYVDGKARQARYHCLIEAIPNEGAVKSFEVGLLTMEPMQTNVLNVMCRNSVLKIT